MRIKGLFLLVVFLLVVPIAVGVSSDTKVASFSLKGKGPLQFDLSGFSDSELNQIHISVAKFQELGEISQAYTVDKKMTLSFPDERQKEVTLSEGKLSIEYAVESYIVEFKSPSLVEKQVALSSGTKLSGGFTAASRETLRTYRETLKSEHEQALKDLSKISTKSPSGSGIASFFLTLTGKAVSLITGRDIFAPEEVLLQPTAEFYTVINGVVVDAKTDELQKIQELPYVKKVYPNKLAKIALTDSVPLIGADKAWSYESQDIPTIVSLEGSQFKISVNSPTVVGAVYVLYSKRSLTDSWTEASRIRATNTSQIVFFQPNIFDKSFFKVNVLTEFTGKGIIA